MNKNLSKGATAEENLRNYFLSIGYFVLRGVKFKFHQFDVTDIDLWLYSRNSPFSRERVNVDIKNKKTPQALERVFWAKGVQNVLGLDSCIVATTDTRPDVREFGLCHEVNVLDGHFLSRLGKSEKSQLHRLSEESFLSELDLASLGKLGGDWRGRYESSKTRTLVSLNFDGCNAWLNDIEYFLENAIITGPGTIPAWRMVYFSISLFLIGLDFLLREHASLEQEQRKVLLENGFRYGKSGREFAEKISRVASSLVGAIAGNPQLSKDLEKELNQQAKLVKADVLAEFFSRNPAQGGIFDLAREFESHAFSQDFQLPLKLSINAQSVIAVLCDFINLDRKKALI